MRCYLSEVCLIVYGENFRLNTHATRRIAHMDNLRYFLARLSTIAVSFSQLTCRE
jgi:hypothetical protein